MDENIVIFYYCATSQTGMEYHRKVELHCLCYPIKKEMNSPKHLCFFLSYNFLSFYIYVYTYTRGVRESNNIFTFSFTSYAIS